MVTGESERITGEMAVIDCDKTGAPLSGSWDKSQATTGESGVDAHLRAAISPVVRRRGKQRVCIWSEAGGNARPKTERNRRAAQTRGENGSRAIGVELWDSAQSEEPAGVAPGPHHNLSPSRLSLPDGQLPPSNRGPFFIAVTATSPGGERHSPRFSDGRPGWIDRAFPCDQIQPGFPNFVNELGNDRADCLPASRSVVSCVVGPVHSPEVMKRSKQCPIGQSLGKFEGQRSEKFFQ